MNVKPGDIIRDVNGTVIGYALDDSGDRPVVPIKTYSASYDDPPEPSAADMASDVLRRSGISMKGLHPIVKRNRDLRKKWQAEKRTESVADVEKKFGLEPGTLLSNLSKGDDGADY